MNDWHQDLMNLLVIPVGSPQDVFATIECVASRMGFEYIAYGFQSAYPVTKPKTSLMNNYPGHWQEHYVHHQYILSDPTVLHCKNSQSPVLWSDETFSTNQALWRDAKDHGMRVGWAQSSIESNGSGSMVTLCRSDEPLTENELNAKESQMRWLVQVAHMSLSRALKTTNSENTQPLTLREREVLKWTADGKSAQDIADILKLSKSAVDFHLSNCIRKLNSPNKTAAVARAILQGSLWQT